MMKKVLCVLLVLTIFCCTLQVVTFAAQVDGYKAVFSESFDSFATNAEVDTVDVSGSKCFVKEYEFGNKGLEINTALGVSKIKTGANLSGKFFVSFAIGSDNKINVKLTGSYSGGAVSLFELADSVLCTYNGEKISSVPGEMTTYSVFADTLNSSYSIYADKKCLISDSYISGLSGKEFNSFDLTFSSGNGAVIILDNLCVGKGSDDNLSSVITLASTDSEYNSAVVEEYDSEDAVREEVYFNYDCSFENGFSTTRGAKGNTIQITKETDDNDVILFKRITAADFHLDIDVETYPSSIIVYEYDIFMISDDCVVSNVFKSTDSVFWTPFTISKGNLNAGEGSVELNAGQWYTISLVYDTVNNIYDVYVDYEPVAQKLNGNSSYYHSNANIWRIHTTRTSGDDEFMIDNIAAYGGSVPRCDIGEADIVITGDRIYEKDTTQRNLLRNTVSYHLRSGVVYSNGEKFVEKPIVKDGVSYVKADFFEKTFSCTTTTDTFEETVTVDGAVFKTGSDIAVINGKEVELSAPVAFSDGEIYLPLRDVCSRVLKKAVVYNNDAPISGGMVLISDEVFTADESIDIQKLNDFALYERPDAEKIIADYEASPNKGLHPRVMADKLDFDRIRNTMQTDKTVERWVKGIISSADGYLANTEPLIYELRDGVRLWYVSQDMIAHMLPLGFAYQITGDQKYADRAWIDLESVSNFPSWHPEHQIDVGGLATGVAIGYDWMYDAFTPEQREIIEKGARRLGLYQYVEAYQGRNSHMGGVKADNNFNQIINAGGATLGIALMDVYPEVAAYCIAESVRCLEFANSGFAPEGAWWEGIGYGGLTLEYLSYQLSSLKTTFGTIYSHDATQGIDAIPYWYLYMQSKMGAFAYGDGASTSVSFDSGALWLCNHYENYEALSAIENMFDIPGSVRAILWYNPENVTSSTELPLDKAYATEQLWLMRDTWNGESQNTFAGLIGGAADHAHAHGDIGKFEFFANGVQWTKDIGGDNYNLPDYFNWHGGFDNGPAGKRWKIWRLRGESHSTLIVDPDSQFEFDPFEEAKLIRTESKPRGSIAVIDSTAVHRGKVKSAQRGAFFTDERRSLVIRDEVTMTKPGKLYWHMITGQDAKLSDDGKSVIISEKGNPENYVTLNFVCDTDFELTIGPGRLLPNSPTVEGMVVDENICQIRLDLDAEDEVNITAKLTPSTVENGADISEYDMPMTEWIIPDGEIPGLPVLDSIFVDGVNYNVNSKVINHYISEFRNDIPEVVAVSEKYDVEIKPATRLDQYTTIVVRDRENKNNFTTYKVGFTILKSAGIVALEERDIVNITASAEPQIENNVRNVLDRDLDTRWSAEGAQYLIVDLGKDVEVDTVVMSFMNGDSRRYATKISTSSDGVVYNECFNGTSGGTTSGYELFNIGNSKCRYIKLDFSGHANGTWNSVTEVAVGKRK